MVDTLLFYCCALGYETHSACSWLNLLLVQNTITQYSMEGDCNTKYLSWVWSLDIHVDIPVTLRSHKWRASQYTMLFV